MDSRSYDTTFSESLMASFSQVFVRSHACGHPFIHTEFDVSKTSNKCHSNSTWINTIHMASALGVIHVQIPAVEVSEQYPEGDSVRSVHNLILDIRREW